MRLLLALIMTCVCACIYVRRDVPVRTGIGSETIKAKHSSGIEIVEKKRFIDMSHIEGKYLQIIRSSGGRRKEVIMPGDHLVIRVYEKLPVSNEARNESKDVDEDGSLLLFPLGRITLAGMTLTEARLHIEEKMKEFVRAPSCEIIRENRVYEPKVYVFGEAKTNGAMPLNPGDHLIDILSKAGGYTEKAFLTSVKLVRIYDDSVGVMSINVKDIMKRGYVENNLMMQDQDVVYIPTQLLSGAIEAINTISTFLPWYYFLKNF